MNKDTRDTIDLCENRVEETYLLACQFYYTYENSIGIYGGS